jgi:hypothetical protein
MPIEGVMEKISDTLYDSTFLEDAVTNLFCASVGTPDRTRSRTKQWIDTNMVCGGMLPAPHKFVITQWTCALFRDGKPISIEDDFWQRVSLTLSLDAKLYSRTAAFLIADPKCVFLNVDASNEKKIGEVIARYPAPSTFDEPIHIEQLQGFTVQVETETPDPSVKVMVCLIGTRFRPVL